MLTQCENCQSPVNGDVEFCEECGIPVHSVKDEESFFICPVCEAKNPPGEKKCKYCCSLF
jgi:hypothetical protein